MKVFYALPFLFAWKVLSAAVPVVPDGVKLQIGDINITSGQLVVSDGKASALGGVYFSSKDFYACCSDINFDINSKSVDAKQGQVLLDRLVITAADAHYNQEEIAAEDAEVYLQFGTKDIGPHIYGKSIHYDREKESLKISGGHVTLGKMPVMWIPNTRVNVLFLKDLKTEFHTGHTRDKGYYFCHESLFPVYSGVGLGYILNYYSRHGFLLGPNLKLSSNSGPVKGNLKLRTAGISDRAVKKLSPMKRRRWFLDLQENYHLRDRVDTITNLYWVSDEKFDEDFFENSTENQFRDIFSEIDFRGDNTLFTAMIRPKINKNQVLAQQLPSLRWNYFPKEIADTGVYVSGFIDFTRFKYNTAEVQINRIDGYVGLHYPVNLEGYHITPRIGARWTKYGSHSDRMLGELGFDWNVEYSKIYDQNFPLTNYNHWQHILRPVVQFRYFPRLSRKREHFIFESKKNDHLLPLGLDSRYDADDLSERSTLRLGLEQDFLCKTKKNRIVEFSAINFYQDFNFVRKRFDDGKKEDLLGNFYCLSEIQLKKWLKCSLYTRHRWDKFRFDEVCWRTDVTSGDIWDFGVFTKFRRHKYNQFGVDFSMRLNEVSRFGIMNKFDVRSKRFLSAEVFFETCLSEVWDCHFFCKIKNHNRKHGGRFQPGFYITLRRW